MHSTSDSAGSAAQDAKPPLAHALDLLESFPSLRVFPLAPNSKEPLLGWTKWQHRATSDPFKVQQWLNDSAHADCNYAVAAEPSGLIIVDLDNKPATTRKDGTPVPAKRGEAEWRTIADGRDVETFAVRTPSGGLHRYYKGEPKKSGVNVLAYGVDIRSAGGYVVGPGSILEGKRYEVVVSPDTKIADAPPFLPERLAAKPTRDPRVRRLDCYDMTDKDRARAIAYLKAADPAIQGAGGDNQTYLVAARLFDFGLDVLTATDLMFEYYDPRCVPRWGYDDLLRKVEHAHAYRQQPVGCDTDAGWIKTERERIRIAFEGLNAADFPAPAPWLHRFGSHNLPARADIPEPEYLCDETFPVGTLSVLNAEGGVGKTQLGLQLQYALAAGVPFLGMHTPGTCLSYGLYAEDDEKRNLPIRAHDICKGLGIEPAAAGDRAYHVSTLDMDLTLFDGRKIAGRQPGETKIARKIFETIEMDRALGRNPKLLILDNAAAFYSGEENYREQVSGFLRYLARKAYELGIAIILLTHTSKADDGRPSGSTAWVNVPRTVLNLTKEPNDRSVAYLVTTKMNGRRKPVNATLEDSDGFFSVAAKSEPTAFERDIIECVDRYDRKGTPLVPARNADLSLANIVIAERYPGKSEAERKRFRNNIMDSAWSLVKRGHLLCDDRPYPGRVKRSRKVFSVPGYPPDAMPSELTTANPSHTEPRR